MKMTERMLKVQSCSDYIAMTLGFPEEEWEGCNWLDSIEDEDEACRWEEEYEKFLKEQRNFLEQ